jgi:hypothetical protein
MAKDKIKTGKPKSLMGDEVSRQQEHDRKRLMDLAKSATEIPKDFKPVYSYNIGESEADTELKKARARLMNALSGLIERWPESQVAEALADKIMKDIST